ncbi:hypothetical protein K7432_010959 [Basidiobolus ranarum]|uniref:Uncharacterized protein n=1 Tax=Basidiobolus ranarum TaxID=34480 RepID=A0ABR2WN04_9FUNG
MYLLKALPVFVFCSLVSAKGKQVAFEALLTMNPLWSFLTCAVTITSATGEKARAHCSSNSNIGGGGAQCDTAFVRSDWGNFKFRITECIGGIASSASIHIVDEVGQYEFTGRHSDRGEKDCDPKEPGGAQYCRVTTYKSDWWPEA